MRTKRLYVFSNFLAWLLYSLHSVFEYSNSIHIKLVVYYAERSCFYGNQHRTANTERKALKITHAKSTHEVNASFEFINKHGTIVNTNIISKVLKYYLAFCNNINIFITVLDRFLNEIILLAYLYFSFILIYSFRFNLNRVFTVFLFQQVFL